MNPDDLSKLRMTPLESAEDLADRLASEHQAELQRRQQTLEEHVLAPFRVGSVPYLNAVPLTRGLETQITFATPARLAEMLQRDALDAALVSTTEVLLNDRYDILDGVAIAALGEVKSVFLAHRRPIDSLDAIHCDPASLTSVNLLRVLLAERGLHPALRPLDQFNPSSPPEAFLLIGDPALDFSRAPGTHSIWDLGEAWTDLTRLPMVFAVWALRRGVENKKLCRLLREAKDFGMDTLDQIIHNRTEYDLDFRKDYLGWHIHFHLGDDEKRGIEKFADLLRKHGLGPVYNPRYVA